MRGNADVTAIELPSLPPGWRYQPVGATGVPDEQTVLTGPFGTNLGREDFRDSGVPVLTIGCLTEGGISLSKALYVSEQKARELRRYRLREGDLLFSRMASVGRAGLVPRWLEGALFNYHIMRLRLDESQIDSRLFVNYVRGASQVRNYLQAVNHGATRDGINTEQLLGLPIAVPPLDEQRQIVADIEKQFSRLDEAIANVRRVKANLKRYTSAVLRDACEGALGKGERNIEDGDTSAVSGGNLPAGWSWTKVGDVGRLQLGRQRSPKYHFGPNMRPYLRVQNVFEDRIDLSDVMEMEFSEEDFARFALRPGDILLNEGQSPELLGRPAMYRGELPGACFTNTLIRFQAHPGVLPEFALMVFRHYMRSGRFAKESNITTNIAHLSLGRLSNVEFPLAPIADQRRIVAEVDRRLSIVRELEAEVDANLKRAQALRQAVLAKAFSGAHA